MAAEDVLGERGYRTLRRAAETHRSDLVLRLGAEAGLRPAEMTRVRTADVVEFGDHLFLGVRGDDGVDREAYLPADVEHDLRKFANGVDAEEPVLSVSPRRVQMLVGKVAERAAETAPRLRDVSSRDLRWRFAASLLEDGVPPDVVCALGGWDRLDRLGPLLDDPGRERVVTAVERATADQSGGELRRLVAGVAAVSESLVGATTGEEVATGVCERLAETADYRFAWLADRTGDGLTPRVASDVPTTSVERHLDAVPGELGVGDVETVATPDGPVALVPVVEDHAVAGVVGIGVRDAIEDGERALLSALGVQVGHARAAVERKRLLLADAVTELEFRCTDGRAFTVDLSGSLDCTVELSGIVPVDGRSLLYYLVVEGAPAESVLSRASSSAAVADARLLEEYRDGALLEAVVTDAPALQVVGSDGRIRELTATAGAATITVELPGESDVRPTVDAVVDAYPETSLVAKRRTERPVETDAGFRERLTDRLTDRQETVLRAAYHGGYFEWPRESTAEELADALDVSSPTLHNHLRKAQGKVLTAFFDDETVAPPRSLDP